MREHQSTSKKPSLSYGSGYKHDVFLHYNGTHNGWKDNDSKRRNQTVIADPIAWLDVSQTNPYPENGKIVAD